MKILLDECVPQRLSELLEKHQVRTVPEMSWASIKNGQLLTLAAQNFDLMITVDKKMAVQQESSKLRLPVVILAGRSTQFKHLKPLITKLMPLLESVPSNDFHFIRG